VQTRRRQTTSDSETDTQVPGLIEMLRWIDPLHNPDCGKKEPPAQYRKDGLLAYANGTDWNPGSGKGYYRWNVTGSVWVYVG